jgi:TatA/E family protein of Tat protein translocase
MKMQKNGIAMFGAGELVLIIILAILLFGPDKLPDVARSIGKIYAEYQRAKREFELELMRIPDVPVVDANEKIQKVLDDLVTESEPTSSTPQSQDTDNKKIISKNKITTTENQEASREV